MTRGRWLVAGRRPPTRTSLDDGRTVVIGLVDAGRGTMKPHLVKDMIRQLHDNGLIPAEFTEGSDDALDE